MPMLIPSPHNQTPQREKEISRCEIQSFRKWEKDAGKCGCQMMEKDLPCASNVNGRKDSSFRSLLEWRTHWKYSGTGDGIKFDENEFLSAEYKTLHDLKNGQMKKEWVISYFPVHN